MANQANVELTDLLFQDIPGTKIFQLSYTENLNATTETAEVANEANREAENANTRNNEQDREIAANSDAINITQKQLSNVLLEVSEISGDVEQVEQGLNNHVSSNSQHGVTGDNVGTENYAQELIGGVVLLAANIAQLTNNTINVGLAPAAYDQAYAQSQTDAINSLASKQNDIINKINELIQGQITAKQMGV